MMFKYYLGLGSNIEPRFNYLQKAISELNNIGDIKKKSRIYETGKHIDGHLQFFHERAFVANKIEIGMLPPHLL